MNVIAIGMNVKEFVGIAMEKIGTTSMIQPAMENAKIAPRRFLPKSQFQVGLLLAVRLVAVKFLRKKVEEPVEDVALGKAARCQTVPVLVIRVAVQIAVAPMTLIVAVANAKAILVLVPAHLNVTLTKPELQS